MRNTLRRLTALEMRKSAPPSDLFGRYYDELSHFDRLRYWLYVYGGNRFGLSLEDFERMEVPTYHDSLHFIIEEIPESFDFPELDEWEAGLDRMFR